MSKADDPTTVTLHRSPLKTLDSRTQLVWKGLEGKDLSHYLSMASDYLKLKGDELCVVHNGKVESDLSVIPRPGDNICIHPTLGAFIVPLLPSLAVSIGLNLASMGLQALFGTSQGISTNIDAMLPRMESPTPSISGLGNRATLSSLTYGWKGAANSDQPGLPIPVLYGKCRIGLQVINSYLETSGHEDVLYSLYGVSEGVVSEVVADGDDDNIWLGPDVRLSETDASWQERTGTYDQTSIGWFDDLHQMREIGSNLYEPMKLLLHFEDLSTDGYFDDSSIYDWTVDITNNVSRSVTQTAIGSYSGYFAGGAWAAPDHLSVYDSGGDGYFSLGNSDFTIDFHMYCTSTDITTDTGYSVTLCSWINTAPGDPDLCDGWALVLHRTASGNYVLLLGSQEPISGDPTLFVKSEDSVASSFPLNDWAHVSVVRNGARFYIFKDGVDVTDTTFNSNWTKPIDDASSNVAMTIGKFAPFNLILGSFFTPAITLYHYGYKGYIDEFRFTRRADYTQEFTPPTVAYDNEYSGGTITTRGEADQVNIHFEFPYGLYAVDSSGQIEEKEVSYFVKFREHDSGDAYLTCYGSTTPQVAKAATRSPHKVQFNIPFNALVYNSMTGTVSAGDKVYGNNSASTATVMAVDTVNKIAYFSDHTGNFGTDTQVIKTAGTHYLTKTITTRYIMNKKAKWDIQVWRTTLGDDEGFESDKSTMFWNFMDEIYRQTLGYPNTGLFGLRFPASEKIGGGVLGQVSTISDRGAPSRDYFGSTSTYSLSIPSMALYDMMTNTRYGAGLSHSQLDANSLAYWYYYCGTNVTGGDARCLFNGIFDTSRTIQDALLSILKVGRASMFKSGGKYYVVVEGPTSTTQLFTVGNIRPGTFRCRFIPKKTRPHAISIDYLDASDNYNRKTYTHYGTDYDTTSDPLRVEKELLLGCTSMDQAKRYAILRYQLSTMINRVCEFEAGTDAVACQPGDVIAVQHDSSWQTYGGRVMSATANTITLDREVNLDSATWAGYGLLKSRASSDDSLQEKSLAGPYDTDTDTLNISGTFSKTPSLHDVYGIFRSSYDVHLYRVLSMSRTQEQIIRLSCLEYNERCYYHKDYGGGVIDGGGPNMI